MFMKFFVSLALFSTTLYSMDSCVTTEHKIIIPKVKFYALVPNPKSEYTASATDKFDVDPTIIKPSQWFFWPINPKI